MYVHRHINVYIRRILLYMKEWNLIIAYTLHTCIAINI